MDCTRHMWVGVSQWEDPDKRADIRDCFVTGEWGEEEGEEDEGFGEFEVWFILGSYYVQYIISYNG